MPSIYELPGGRRIVADADFVAIHQPGATLIEHIAPPPPPIPGEVTMRQARDVLIDTDMIDQVEAAIDAIADPLAKRKARNAWEYSSAVQRGNGLLAQLAPALGLTSEQLDNLFLEASKR